MSASDNNARSMMPPPHPPQGLKHKGSALPEPAPKRKTLAERAGETHRPSAMAMPRPVNGAVKASAAIAKRNLSNSTSTITRSTSTRTMPPRQPSASSLSSRPTSAASSYRAASTLSHPRSRTAMASTRQPLSPQDEYDSEEEEDSTTLPTKRKGMQKKLSSLRATQSLDYININLSPRKQRKRSEESTLSEPRPHDVRPVPFSLRDMSITTAFQTLSLKSNISQVEQEDDQDMSFPLLQEEPQCPKTPSYIPKPVAKTPQPAASLPAPVDATPFTHYKVVQSTPGRITYLTRDSNLLAPAWDTKGRLEDMEVLYSQLKSQLDSASKENHGMEDSISLCKTRSMAYMCPHCALHLLTFCLVNELEAIRMQAMTQNQALTSELSEAKIKLSSVTTKLDDAIRAHNIELDDIRRKHRNELEDTKDDHRKELERQHREARDESERLRRDTQDEIERLTRSRKEELAERERELKAELEEERSRRVREVQELTTQFAIQRQNTDMDVSNKDRELQALKNDLAETQARLDGSNALVNNLNEKLAESAANALTLDTSMRAMKAKIDFLESDNQAQSQAFQEIHQQMQDAVDRAAEAQEKLRQEETLRRKLHNQVQELKGNIRVFCRVRPTLGDEENQKAEIGFPDAEADSKEVAIQGPEVKSAVGNVTRPVSGFSFDRVFSPSSQNGEIFEEISQLVQSALDGYNVCIFCYGQTGSGKTYTMSSLDGMIPRAVNQIYETAKGLEEKGWTYTMEGSFVEVYNETINDLLGNAEDWEKKKHEIRQDPVKCKTIVTDATIVNLDTPNRVNEILEQAAKNRRVAATAANSRSSRSHSVFILKLTGENSITGERSEGTLNLVDLAGSERLGHSQATGDRLRETQNINKSLSCLGDVISALGQGKDAKHVPYRNSKV